MKECNYRSWRSYRVVDLTLEPFEDTYIISTEAQRSVCRGYYQEAAIASSHGEWEDKLLQHTDVIAKLMRMVIQNYYGMLVIIMQFSC